MSDNNKNQIIVDIGFSELLVEIVLGWLLVALWQRVIENFAYNTLGLDRDSAFQTLIVALFFTIVFLAYTFIFGSFFRNISGSGTFTPVAPIGTTDDLKDNFGTYSNDESKDNQIIVTKIKSQDKGNQKSSNNLSRYYRRIEQMDQEFRRKKKNLNRK